MALRPLSWFELVSCGGALMLAVLAGVHAAAQTLQQLAPVDATTAACRAADAQSLDRLRPLVTTDTAVDPRIFRSALMSLDRARSACRDGDSTAGLASYAQLDGNLRRYAESGAWPLDNVPPVTVETLPPPRAAALRLIF